MAESLKTSTNAQKSAEELAPKHPTRLGNIGKAVLALNPLECHRLG